MRACNLQVLVRYMKGRRAWQEPEVVMHTMLLHTDVRICHVPKVSADYRTRERDFAKASLRGCLRFSFPFFFFSKIEKLFRVLWVTQYVLGYGVTHIHHIISLFVSWECSTHVHHIFLLFVSWECRELSQPPCRSESVFSRPFNSEMINQSFRSWRAEIAIKLQLFRFQVQNNSQSTT
jgi:hypothetical protein